MSKQTLKRITVFDSTDLTAAEEYFTKMAESGWMLNKLGPVSEFTRCEPQKLRFSVQILYFERGTDYEKTVKGYTELCGEAGWRSVSSYAGMHVFVTGRDDVPEIVTDPLERIKAVTKQSRAGVILLWILLLLFIAGAAQFILSIAEGKSFASLLALEFPLALCFAALLLFAVTKTASFLKWRRAARRSAASNMPIRYYSLRVMRLRRALIYVGFGLMAAAGLLSLVGVCI